MTSVIIAQHTGFELTDVHFLKPNRGDIATVNENKVKLIQLFGLCFNCYAKICTIKALKLELDERYSLVRDAEYNVDD